MALRQRRLPDVSIEGGMGLQKATGILVGIQHANRLLEIIDDDPHRLHQVRVPAHHDCALKSILISIVQKMGCEIDVRTLLFGLEDFDKWVLSR